MANVNTKKLLTANERDELLNTLQVRFEKNMFRHKGLTWAEVERHLEIGPEKLWSLNEMERTGGEPDVVGQTKKTGDLLFVDCSAESPAGRRSLCFDREALDKRKENKPRGSALGLAAEMGIEILDETQY